MAAARQTISLLLLRHVTFPADIMLRASVTLCFNPFLGASSIAGFSSEDGLFKSTPEHFLKMCPAAIELQAILP